MKIRILIILGMAMFWSCQPHKAIEINGFDSNAFQSDRGACNNIRPSLISILQENKQKLLGVSENEIFMTLGRYDYEILDKKNEKSFVYFLEPGAHCLNSQNKSTANCILIKFNSISLTKEVLFIKGTDL